MEERRVSQDKERGEKNREESESDGEEQRVRAGRDTAFNR